MDEPVSLPDELEVALAVIIDDKDDLDEQDRSRLHEDLRESAAQIERGEVYPIEQVLAEI